MKRRATHRGFWLALILSLAVHAGLFSLLIATPRHAPAPIPPSSDARSYQPPEPASLAGMLDQQTVKAMARSLPDQQAALARSMDQLAAISDTALEGILDTLAQSRRVDRSTHVPRDDAAGAFDLASAVPREMRRTPDGVQWLMVDAAGRTLSVDAPAESLSVSDRAALRVFETANQHPKLRRVLDLTLQIMAQPSSPPPAAEPN